MTSLFFQSVKLLTKTTQVVITNVQLNVAVEDEVARSQTSLYILLMGISKS